MTVVCTKCGALSIAQCTCSVITHNQYVYGGAIQMTDISNLKPGDALTYEQAMARADALRWVLEQLDVETGYATPIYDPYGSVGMERVRLRDLIEKELSE